MSLPAKLRMPVALPAALLARDRLFEALDGDGASQAVWVAGPPGAGKTVLVQTWVQARRPVYLWYRVDSADTDPALLPQGLREAACEVLGEVLTGRPSPLPLLTPDWRGNLDAYASKFFSPLFEAIAAFAAGQAAASGGGKRTPSPVPVLVLDNLDEAIASEEFVRLVAAAVECADPGQVHIVLIARSEPASRFARLDTHERLTRIGYAQLRTTPDEAQALLALRGARLGASWSAEEAARLNDWCEGWVSGLVLASGGVRGMPAPEGAAIDPERLFAYMAATVFDGQPAEVRELMLTAALMPTFTAPMVECVCRDTGADEVLSELVGANLFVTVRARSPVAVYEFHALLREFLLARGRETWTAAERDRRLCQAAEALLADQQIDAAAEALIEARAWDDLAALLRNHAEALAEGGRAQTLMAWLRRLPPLTLAADPWLIYWNGHCTVLFEPQAGALALTQSFLSFVAAGDLPGQVLAWCSVVEAMALDWRDFSEFDGWIAHGERILRELPFKAVPPELAPRMACAMLSALMWRQPAHPDIGLWHQRARDGLFALHEQENRILIGMSVVIYEAVHWGNHRELDLTYAWIRPTQEVGHLPPLAAMLACLLDALYAWLRGQRERAIEHVRLGRALRKKHGIELPGWVLTCHEIYAWATAGHTVEADAALDYARERELDPTRKLDVDHTMSLMSLIAIQEGRLHDALEATRSSNLISDQLGGPFNWAHGLSSEAQILHELGDTAAARAGIAEALGHLKGARCDIFEFEAQACQALFDIDTGADPTENLRAAFAIGVRNDIQNYIWYRPAMFAKLCARALELGIERDYVLRMIERRELDPPYALEAWPWPVRLHCADAEKPRLWVRGDLVEPQRSTVDAPIRLLLGIVALASQVAPQTHEGHALPLRPVERALLGQYLRPGANDGSIDDWLNQNLKRLRKRLGISDAVLSWAGKIALNPARVWVDVLDGDTANQ